MMIKSKEVLNKCNVYLTLIFVYNMQGTFYGYGSMLAKFVLLIFLFFSAYFWVVTNRKYNLPKILKTLNVIIIMFTIYGIVLDLFEPNIIARFSGMEYLKNIYTSLLPVYACYYFSKKSYLNAKSIRVWFGLFVIMSVGKFFAYENQRLANTIYDVDGLTNNIAYYFVALIPMTYLFRTRSIIQYISLLFILLFVIYGMKRGAILIALVLFILLLNNNFEESSNKNKFLLLILGVSVICFLAEFVSFISSTSNYFQYRVESTLEGSSSNREDYYLTFFDYFARIQNPLTLLFGSGAYATVRINGNLAHNDWFEILINNGVVGIVIYMIYMKRFWNLYWKNRNTIYSLVLLSLFIFCFLKSLYSMSYGLIPIMITVMLGYTLVQIECKNEL